jgi:hypothetical protein
MTWLSSRNSPDSSIGTSSGRKRLQLDWPPLPADLGALPTGLGVRRVGRNVVVSPWSRSSIAARAVLACDVGALPVPTAVAEIPRRRQPTTGPSSTGSGGGIPCRPVPGRPFPQAGAELTDGSACRAQYLDAAQRASRGQRRGGSARPRPLNRQSDGVPDRRSIPPNAS